MPGESISTLDFLQEVAEESRTAIQKKIAERLEELQNKYGAVNIYEMVAEFNDYFGVPRSDENDHRLPYDLQTLKIVHMKEELSEYCEAVTSGNMEQAFDALIDLIYVALGAAHAHRFKFNAGFKRVHDANMQKQRAEKASDSKRGSKYDVVKPPGWKPASLADLL